VAASTGPLPVTAPDQYGASSGQPGYLDCFGTEFATLQVNNGGVVFQFGRGSPASFEGAPEVPRPPSVDRLPVRCDAIRYRKQIAGATPAPTVSIDTQP
jgi:hypothetical protein